MDTHVDSFPSPGACVSKGCIVIKTILYIIFFLILQLATRGRNFKEHSLTMAWHQLTAPSVAVVVEEEDEDEDDGLTLEVPDTSNDNAPDDDVSNDILLSLTLI